MEYGLVERAESVSLVGSGLGLGNRGEAVGFHGVEIIVDRGHGRLETKVTSSIIVFSRDNYPLLLLPQFIILSN